MTPLALFTFALVAMAPHGHHSQIYVQLGAAQRAEALHVARQYGAVTPMPSKPGEYTISLKSGVSAHNALVALRADRRVGLAWSDSEPLSKGAKMQSVSVVTAMLDAVKPSRDQALEELRASRKGEHDGHDEKGADYLGGYLYFLSRRAYPYDRMDWSAYSRAEAHAGTMPAFTAPSGSGGVRANAMPSGGGTKKWQFIGPANLGKFDSSQGSYNGRVNAIAYDPAHKGTYYVGGAEGGVWKTTNSGVNWAPLGDAWPFICVSSIALDPTNSQIIYAGTGDFPGWLSHSTGIMKSTNGGVTWVNQGKSQFGDSCVSAVVVDPDNPSIVTAATGDGRYHIEPQGNVWQSVNGGTTWTPIIPTTADWSDVSISLKDGSSRHYYAAGTSGGTVTLERSENQGASWTTLTPPTGTTGGSCLLTPSAVDGKTVYFFCPIAQKVYKSTDIGGTWTDITGNLGTLGDWGQADYDYYLTVFKSGTSDDIFVGLIDVFELPVGMTNWVSVIHAYTGNELTHVDQHCLTVNPGNPNEILTGNDGGVYRGTRSSASSAWTFTSLNDAIGVTQFYSAAWSPTNAKVMIGGAQDNGTPIANGDLANWSDVIGGDGFFCGINPANNLIQYGTLYYNLVFETQDGWKSFSDISPPIGPGEPTPFVSIVQQDPVNTKYLYCTSNYLYRWDNTAQSWTSHVGGTSLSNGADIHCVSVAPSNGKVIYTGSDDGQIFVSRDGGATFTSINSPSLPNRSISSISVDRKNANSIVVGLSGSGTAHLVQCTNTLVASPTYVSVSGSGSTGLPDISLNCMDRDQGNQANVWYVGTDVGVFATTNGGKTWTNATTPLGLPVVQVTAIQTTLYQTVNVSTYGRGMWKLPISAIGGSGQAPNTVEAIDGSFIPSPPIPVAGFVQELKADDGITVRMASGHNAAAQAQAATMEADFNFGFGHTLSGGGFSITTSSSVRVTMQLFLWNNTTNRYDVITSYASTPGLSNTVTIMNVPNPALYMNSAGLVKAAFRALSPDRNGSPFQLTMDSFTISPSIN